MIKECSELQGDVGSGKTIVSFLSAANVIESNYQCALMGPTEILAYQHFWISKKIFKDCKIRIEFLTVKLNLKKKQILNDLKNEILIW